MNCRTMLTRRIYWGAELMRLWIYTLLALPVCCSGTTATASNNNNKSIYRESLEHSNYQPPGCRRTIKPAYYMENTDDFYRLVVTIPEKVSRKKLKIDVDYDDGHIEIFGFWPEGGVRGADESKKMCVYGIWEIDAELMSEEAIVSSDLVSVYDMFMSMQDHQLILSVPVAIEQQIPTVAEDDETEARPPAPLASPTYNENEEETSEHDDEERINHQSPIVVTHGTSLWKKFRGLMRVKDQARMNYYHYSNEFSRNLSKLDWSPWDLDSGYLPPSSLAYEKYRQEALEKFLAYTLANTMDQNSN